MLKPLGSRLLIKKVIVKEITSAGGIITSGEETAPASIRAEVVAVGPDVDPTIFKVGNVVLVAQFAPTQAKEIPSDDTYIVPCEDVLAVIVPDQAKK